MFTSRKMLYDSYRVLVVVTLAVAVIMALMAVVIYVGGDRGGVDIVLPLLTVMMMMWWSWWRLVRWLCWWWSWTRLWKSFSLNVHLCVLAHKVTCNLPQCNANGSVLYAYSSKRPFKKYWQMWSKCIIKHTRIIICRLLYVYDTVDGYFSAASRDAIFWHTNWPPSSEKLRISVECK